jgi:hypothetical protein
MCCRLWKRDNLVDRYFLVLRKAVPGQAAAVNKKRPASSLEVNVLPKGAASAKNSKIKFE